MAESEIYHHQIDHGSRFGFPSKSGWCDMVVPLLDRGAFPGFGEIERDLDHGRVEAKGVGESLMLSGFSYLGLNRRPEIKEAIVDAIDRFSSGSAGSQWLAGHTTLHRELEERLAQVHGTEDALLFSSGFVTNVATLSAMVGRRDEVFGDRINHASLIDGCLNSGAKFTRFRHNDIEQLDEQLAKSTAERRLVVVDGVGSMAGSVCDGHALTEVCERREALLMVDECHSHFVLGKTGGGVREHLGLRPEQVFDLEMGTLGKALHSAGGYIASSRDICNYLRRAARGFVYSRSLSIIDVASCIAALDIFEAERTELVGSLVSNRATFVDACRANGLEVEHGPTPIVPIPVGPAVTAAVAAAECRKNGVFIHSVSPPVVPKGKSILRASMMASHRPEDLEEGARVLAQAIETAKDLVTPEEAALM